MRYWAKSGRLIPLYRGVFAIGHDALRREGRWRAALLAYGDDAALSHVTAVAALELGSSWAWMIDVSVPKDRRRRPGVRVHRSLRLGPGDVVEAGLLRITSPTRTVLDLWRTHAPAYVENVAASAERRGLLDYARIDAEAPLALRTMLGRGPKLVRAKVEAKLLRAIRAAGLPEPETNVWLTHGGGEQWQPDLLFRRERVIVELDDDSHKTAKAFELDRHKDVTRQLHGYATPRFTLKRVDEDLDGVLHALASLLDRQNGR